MKNLAVVFGVVLFSINSWAGVKYGVYMPSVPGSSDARVEFTLSGGGDTQYITKNVNGNVSLTITYPTTSPGSCPSSATFVISNSNWGIDTWNQTLNWGANGTYNLREWPYVQSYLNSSATLNTCYFGYGDQTGTGTLGSQYNSTTNFGAMNKTYTMTPSSLSITQVPGGNQYYAMCEFEFTATGSGSETPSTSPVGVTLDFDMYLKFRGTTSIP